MYALPRYPSFMLTRMHSMFVLLEAVLDFVNDSDTLDETKVYLMGFSQNAL